MEAQSTSGRAILFSRRPRRFSGVFPDSLWTAENFLSFQPLASAIGERAFHQSLARHYDPLEGEGDYRFGDVLVLRRDGSGGSNVKGRGIAQACVYIADNIVYTKAGKGMLQPWVLVKLDQFVHRYIGQNGVKIDLEEVWYEPVGTGGLASLDCAAYPPQLVLGRHALE